MTPTEQRAVLTIALLAAFADGMKDERERETIKRVAESIAGPDDSPQLAQVYQQVLLKRVELADAVAAISDNAHRQLAYELAVCVCDADGARNDAEQQFLAQLKQALGLPEAATTRAESESASIAAAPLSTQTASLSPAMAASSSLGSKESNMSEGDLDKYILNHAIVNGALELLPQSLASMAIIGLQIKLASASRRNTSNRSDGSCWVVCSAASPAD
jgi:tellurite resistance protein